MSQTPETILLHQIIALSWLRTLQEEGVDFINKSTGKPEKDEMVIFEAFENQTGMFDMPKANASRWGMEKNILEVYGSYCLYTTDPYLRNLLVSPNLVSLIKDKIETIKKGDVK